MNYEGSEVYARKSSYWDVPQTTADVCCYVLGVGTLILRQCPPPGGETGKKPALTPDTFVPSTYHRSLFCIS